MKKLKVVLRWTGRTLLVLLATLALFILEENLRGRIMLSRYKAELRAKGEKLTLAELNLPEVPKEGNGAFEFLATTEELTAISKADPLWSYGLSVMRFASAGCAVVLHQKENLVDRRPRPQPPSSKRSSEMGRGRQPEAPRPLPTCSWDELSNDVAAARNVLDKAKDAARQPVLRADLNYVQGFPKHWPDPVKIWRLTDWLSASAFEALHRRNLDVALENITAISDSTRLFKDTREPVLQTVRLSTVNTGLQVTWDALQTEGWTDEQLAKMQESWQRDGCLPDLVSCLEWDRARCAQAYNRDTLKDLLDGLKLMSYWREDMQEGRQYRLDTSLLTAHWLIWRAAWFEQSQLRTLRLWSKSLDDARNVAKQKSWAVWPERPKWRWTVYGFLRWMFYDRWRRLVDDTGYDCDLEMQRTIQYETQQEMTVAAIALKRFHLRTGSFPASLSVLVPEFLPELPHDWMDGKPLRYRLNADRTFTLYSVGENGVDNGGDPNSQQPTGSFQMWYAPDAVWPQAASE